MVGSNANILGGNSGSQLAQLSDSQNVRMTNCSDIQRYNSPDVVPISENYSMAQEIAIPFAPAVYDTVVGWHWMRRGNIDGMATRSSGQSNHNIIAPSTESYAVVYE